MNILSVTVLICSCLFSDVIASTSPVAPPAPSTTIAAVPSSAAPVTAAPAGGLPTLPQIRTTTPDPDHLLCHKCQNAKYLSDCSTTERCDRKTQDCFMDQIITEAADVIYNGGCRSKDVCLSSSSSGNFGFGFGLGRKRSLTSCSRCCKSEDRCNRRLCGIPEGTQLGVANCYSCDHRSQNAEQNEVRNPEDCVHMAPCNSNEVCLSTTTVVGGQPEFFFGCYSKAICKVLMNKTFEDLEYCYGQDLTDPNLADDIRLRCGNAETTTPAPGKRESGQVNVCHACCGATGCNYGDCRVLREQMWAYYKNGLLDFDTLTYKKKP